MKKKVRIKSLPQGYHMMPDGTIMKDSAHMAEGGSVNKTLGAIPRGQANLEAERGETVVTNLTGDSVPEHYIIGGKRHSEGGTPLNLPAQSFIFSDTKKMKIKDQDTLKAFNKSYKKGGYTPAEIAKQYDINKYKKELYENGTTDKIAMRTGEMMIDNYRNKLGELAFVQEGMKGFPQGVPSISQEFAESIMDLPMAAYGGYLPKAQNGQESDFVNSFNSMSDKEKTRTVKAFVAKHKDNPSFINLMNRWQISGVQGKRRLMEENPELSQELMSASGISLPQAAPRSSAPVQTGPNSAIQSVEVPRSNAPSFMQQQPLSSESQQSRTPAPAAEVPRKSASTASTSRASSSTKLPEGITQEEYEKLLSVIKGVSSYGNGKYRALAGNDYGYDDKKKLASSATLIGFDKKNSPFSQRKTPGYNDFYGGMKPSDYERRIVEEMEGAEAIKDLDQKQLREKAFKIMGIEATPEMLTKSDKELYNDPKFFNETFYPAFTNLLPEATYRPDLKDDKLMGYEHFDALRKEDEIPPITPTPEKTPDTSITPDKLETTEDPKEGFWLQDKLRGMQDLRNRFGVKKYMPRNFRVDPVITPPTFYSPERELAANEEMVNATLDTLRAFTGPQQLSARASEIAGKGAANAANILGRYNNMNVDVANRDVLRRDALMSAAAEFNTKGLSDYYDKTVIANQAYDNAKRAMDENIVNTVNNAITNAAYTSNLNTLFPTFNIDPTTGGYVDFDRNKARDITKRQLASEQSDYQNKLSTFNQMVRDTGVNPDVAFKTVFGTTSKGMPSMPQTEEELDQYINRQLQQGMTMMWPGAQSMYGQTSQSGE
jgi:hypothetical protein